MREWLKSAAVEALYGCLHLFRLCPVRARTVFFSAYAGKRGLCICTVTDHLYRPEALSPEDRQLSLTQMREVALDTAVRMSKY